MGLPWTPPGMEVEGSTSNMEQTQVYTDGSAMDATRDGGGGVYIQYGAEDRSTLMGLPWTLPGVEGSTSNMEQTQVYTDGSAMDATRDGGVYIQYGAEDRSTLMVCHGRYQGWRWRGLHPIWSRRQVYTDGLPWTLPGMEGSTSNMEQKTGLH